MKNLSTVFHLPRSHYEFSIEDVKKYEFVSNLEDERILAKLTALLGLTPFKPHIKQFVFDYYLYGYSRIKLSHKQADLLEFLDEYFERYLYHNQHEFYACIIAELEYNSYYEDLIVA
ncbi:hypothetical protein CN918_32225 [Priestia megaterium]|nr:hypothetical protein CN918_32225 [Priestia megaterium]